MEHSVVELKGYFTGTVNVKLENGNLFRTFMLQGFEDFEGMKFEGMVWSISPTTNGLSGTILIPN